jgi:nicotinic acid mononucleotide adenylyltransferase
VAFAPPRLIELVNAVDPDGPADLRWVVAPPEPALHRRVGVLPGSFNPPTDAHIALARAGRHAGLATVVYLLSKRTVDKERVTGIPLGDRLELLGQLAEPHGDAVAFANRGLYVDQAAALRRALPDAQGVVFLVGFDKIVQIFDPRYYDDRDAALDRLFALSSFLVAPRGDSGDEDLGELLTRPENARYAAHVRPVPLATEYRDQSSTQVRAGESADVPPVVAHYLAAYHPYGRSG